MKMEFRLYSIWKKTEMEFRLYSIWKKAEMEEK